MNNKHFYGETPEPEEFSPKYANITEHDWYKTLILLSGQLIFYICNKEQLHSLSPFYKMCNCSVILLVEPGMINDESITEPNITIIEFCFIKDIQLYDNQFLKIHSPEIYKYYNTFLFLLKVLSPVGIVFSESEAFQQQILNTLAQKEQIPCLIIPQQGSSTEHSIFQKVSDFIKKTASRHYFEKNRETRLHIGCGYYVFEGWLNVDISDIPGVYYLDAGSPYPFQDNSFDYIFSEHLFEHLTLQQGIMMLQECYRVLKPGGRKRIATPDLNFLIDLYLHPEKEIHQRYIQWSTPKYISELREFYENSTYPPLYTFNNFFHAWGHQFIYTFQELKTLASKIGFKNIRQYAIGESDTSFFVSVEKHGNGIPSWANELETMVIEMEK